MMSGVDFPVFRLDRVMRWSLMIGGAWIVFALLGWIFSPEKFYQSYLLAWMFWLGVCLGSMGVVMIHHLMGGEWGFMVRRLGEHAAMTLPLLIVLFIPIIFGMHSLFPWDRADVLANDPVLRHQEPYLNARFFLIRAVIYAVVWTSLAAYLRSASLRHDRTGSPASAERMHSISAVGMVLYVVTMSFAGVDWLMSRDPHFFSTVFGFIVVAGQGISGMCVLLVLFTLMINTPPFRDQAREHHLNDLGNLLMTFVVFWAYLSFVQLLVVWMGNKQDEIPWYVKRLAGGWGAIGLLLVLLHFGVPFVVLLMRQLKQKVPVMLWLCVCLLVMRGLDLFWQIGPSGEDPTPHVTQVWSWMDVVFPIGMGGLWLAFFLWLAADHSLMSAGDLVPVAKAQVSEA